MIKIHQGETRVFSLLAVDDEVEVKVTSLSEVNLPTHTHEVTLSDSCGAFLVSNNIYLEFYGKNACRSGCYEIKYVDDCGLTVGFDIDGCITPVDGVEIVPTCCGGMITKTNPVATAYRPYNLNKCDTISSHVRVVSSAQIRRPAFVGSYQAGTNVFMTHRRRKNELRRGAVVYIDGVEYTIVDIDDRTQRTMAAVMLDRDFIESSISSKMTYSDKPIAVLGSTYKHDFCAACGVLELSLSEDDSFDLLPGVEYHWDVIARNDRGTKRLGGGVLDVCETFTY